MRLCECGCGKATRLASKTRADRGHVRGQPLRFIAGHHVPANPCPPGSTYLGRRRLTPEEAVARRRERVRLFGVKRREINRTIIRTAKAVPCADCGNYYPYYVMEFDHLDPSQKVNNVGWMLGGSTDALRDEIAKCDVVCANCHRVRTFGDD